MDTLAPYTFWYVYKNTSRLSLRWSMVGSWWYTILATHITRPEPLFLFH